MEMARVRTLRQAAAGAALLLLVVGPALAQSTTEQRPQAPGAGQQSRPANQQQAGGDLNQHIAACLHLGNQAEVAVAQMAQQKAQHPEVKQFAQMMVDQHQQAIAKIEQAAPNLPTQKLQLTGTQGASRTSPSGQPVQASNTVPRDANNERANYETEAAGGGQEQQALMLAKSVHEHCLKLTKEALGGRQGAEFDKAYIGHQVAAHMAMLGALRGSREFATGDLQQVIVEAEQMTEQHLAEAKNIMQQIKDKEGTQASAQRTTATQ